RVHQARQQLFLPTGVLWMAREADPLTLATASTLSNVGVRFEQLDRAELDHRYPQISFGPVTWALYEPDGGTLLARRAVQCLVREAEAAGVQYRQAAVLPPPNGGTDLAEALTTNGESFRAREYIFACGAWLPRLFPELLGEVIQATRQEVCFFGVPPGDARFTVPAIPPWIDFHSEFYGVPDIEHRGFKVALHRHGAPIDPDTDDRQVTSSSLSLIREMLAERFPALKAAPLIESRVCQYENTRTGNFLVDRHPGLENVWLVGGGSGHGFKHGPAMGEFVAGLLTGVQSPEPRFLLAPANIEQQRLIL
ncbi:MAG: FAD-dependent oxidoreductase, partial [Acidobacteriota bacterium]